MKMKAMLYCVIAALFVLVTVAKMPKVSAHHTKHQQYKVVIFPPDGGPFSFFAGYLNYDTLTDRGTAGVASASGNSYTWNDGKQTNLEPLPQLANLTGTSTFINWINQWGLSAGYGTRTDPNGASFDHAAIWTPDGHIFPLRTPDGYQSHAVWVNDYGVASGWIENATRYSCAFGVGVQNESQAVIWQFGFRRMLGTLGGDNSYGEFINNRGQVSGHSEISTVINGCPAIDPFVWEDGKMIDILPGDFGGAFGGTNFLSNGGHAVGFGTLPGDAFSYAFLWHGGKLTNLTNVGTLGGSMDSAFNSNDEGAVVGVSSVSDDSAFHAVMWRDGTFTDLGTVDGDACSQPYRINSHDQVVGFSGACDFSVQHASLWEDGEGVDLNSLIPANSGVQLLSANWINERGEIATLGILAADGTFRAVLLIPEGEDDFDQQDDSAAIKGAAITGHSAQGIASGATKGAPLKLKDASGRLNPMYLRPFSPAKLRNNRPAQ